MSNHHRKAYSLSSGEWYRAAAYTVARCLYAIAKWYRIRTVKKYRTIKTLK
jgi:hypothetical protein